MILIIILLLACSGVLISSKYKQYLANIIHTPNNTVRVGDFNFKIINVAEQTLPLNLQGADLSTIDCDNLTYNYNSTSNQYGFWTDRECSDYNNIRIQAKKYMAEYNGRLVINYSIEAINTTHGKDLRIYVLPDSGRDIILNGGANSGDEQYSFMWSLGKKDYVANPSSNFGGDLNKGLSRKGTMGFDVQSTEKTIDMIIEYYDQKRIIRINR